MKRIFTLIMSVIMLIASWLGIEIKRPEPTPEEPTMTSHSEPDETEKETEPMTQNLFYIKANGTTFIAEFAENTSAEAFKDLLADGDVTVSTHDYGGFEKVSNLGHTLPRNDTYITTEPGDVILYQGNQITVYYDVNSWSFTRLGKIKNSGRDELLAAFGDADVAITFSLNK